MNENIRLANWFNKQREVIEAAELPFAKMAIFILPILSPLVPAFMTGLHMYNLLLELFKFPNAWILCVFLAVIIGVVLELLGYVGAISFIRSIFDLVRKGKDEYLLPAVLTFFAYAFYLTAMFLINVQLGKYFNVPTIINSITGWLSFITVPTGLLAATHLSGKENKEEEVVIRHENREFQLKKHAIKHGINVFQQNVPTQIIETQKADAPKTDWRLLSISEKKSIKNLTTREIMDTYQVGESTAYLWKNKSNKL